MKKSEYLGAIELTNGKKRAILKQMQLDPDEWDVSARMVLEDDVRVMKVEITERKQEASDED